MNTNCRIASWRACKLAILSLSCVAAAAALSAEPAPAGSTQPAATPASANAMPAVATPGPTSPSAAKASPASPAVQGTRRPASDRLNLDTTVVTGNRELPKVLYIVPWKRADLGDLPPQPLNSLLDEVLMPVDRDVFRREVAYFGTINEKDAATPPAAAGSEK